MSKKIFTLVVLVATFAGMSLSAFAQVEHLVMASVPFAFFVEKTQLPAGKYIVERVQTDPTVIAIRSLDGSHNLLVLTEKAEARGAGDHTNLIFDKVNGRYFLSEVWTVGSDWGLVIPEASAEHRGNR